MMSEGSDRTPQIGSLAPVRTRKPRPSRSKGLRVTTGCVVCRTRHMKCDEARPVCGPCAKSNRECVYGTISNVSRRGRAVDLSENSTETTASPEPSQAAISEDRDLQEPVLGKHQPITLHQRPTEDARVDHNAAKDVPYTGPWTRSMDDVQTTDPHSSLSGSFTSPVSVAPLKWFGLLAGDAKKANWKSESASPRFLTPSICHAALPSSSASYVDEPFVDHAGHDHDPSPSSAIPQEVVTLTQYEVTLFTHFVRVLSRWIDLTDPHQHFSVMVPHLAMRNQGLMKAILALCARHLSIKQRGSDLAPDRTLAVQYYYETLGHLQQAMKNESYLRSEELLATVLIISTYEMIDGEGQGWERHLKGAFWIQRSREINGESGGLKQAVWWAWIRQDAWAAFRERRKVLSFFKPTKPYHAMDRWDIAARCVYLLAQCINYMSEQEIEVGKSDPGARVERADELLSKLEEWYQYLTEQFNPLPCLSESEGPFIPIWIHPPIFGIALQWFHCAKILLLVWAPTTGDPKEFVAREHSLEESIDIICGIAMTTTDDAACSSSTKNVYAAGLYVKDSGKRAAVLELLRSHQSHTGWPLQDLRIDLEAEWKKGTTP